MSDFFDSAKSALVHIPSGNPAKAVAQALLAIVERLDVLITILGDKE